VVPLHWVVTSRSIDLWKYILNTGIYFLPPPREDVSAPIGPVNTVQTWHFSLLTAQLFLELIQAVDETDTSEALQAHTHIPTLGNTRVCVCVCVSLGSSQRNRVNYTAVSVLPWVILWWFTVTYRSRLTDFFFSASLRPDSHLYTQKRKHLRAGESLRTAAFLSYLWNVSVVLCLAAQMVPGDLW